MTTRRLKAFCVLAVLVPVASVCLITGALTPTGTALASAKSSKSNYADCLTAIDDYQSVARIAGKFSGLAADYEEEIPAAFDAGAAGSQTQADAIAAKLKVWNGQVGDLTDQLKALAPGIKQTVFVCELMVAGDAPATGS